MNKFLYEEIKVGQTEAFEVEITDDKQDMFRRITQDINPLHSDSSYAQKKGFENKVVFGMLTASFFSTLAGVYLPGENSLVHSVETKFLNPVYIGDHLIISGTVAEKNDVFKVIEIKAVIKKQSGEKVAKAKMQVGVIDD
ncbi:MAG: MaoC/PaaZ C-terminal domain-containing protein [Christensenella sp.]